VTSDLATLCQSCGLCCDGSLFGRVSLRESERDLARRHHLPLLGGGEAFGQPCPALHGETERTCSIYAERPQACARFTCKLYERHREEGGPLEPRLAAVRRVRELLAVLQASGFAPADLETAGSRGAPARLRRAYRELMEWLAEDFARA
jgi:Fe-S-cluster containining protein